MIASLVTFYTSCLHPTHKLYSYKTFIDACANAYSVYVPANDSSSTEDEIEKSKQANKHAFELLVSTILPIALKYLGDNPMQTLLTMMQHWVPEESLTEATTQGLLSTFIK